MSVPPTLTELLALWGAGLSTLLAGVKIWEICSNRFKVDSSYNFTSSEDIGNEVLIRNLTSRAFILTHWELLYFRRSWPLRQFEPLASPEYDDGDTKIEPYSTLKLCFREADYFSTSPRALKGRKLYFRIWVAGRRANGVVLYRSE